MPKEMFGALKLVLKKAASEVSGAILQIKQQYVIGYCSHLVGFEWAPSIKILDIDYGFELPGAGPFTQLWSVIKEQDQLETKRYPVQGLTTR